MAKPVFYPDWAVQTVTLPGTLNTNKIRPKEVIRNVGMDYGQIMTCEEMNWMLNNIGLWVRYLVDEFIPTLPNTYLPLVGTKITMAGDATGNVTWNGNKEVTLSIQVVDNSHNHLSANITDATSTTATPNVLVRRDAGGAIYGGDFYVCGTSTTDPATIFFKNFAGQTVGNISSDYSSGGQLYIYRNNPANGATTAVRIYDAGYVLLDSPRYNGGQDTTHGDALVRLDYMNSRLSSLQNTLQTNINGVQNNLNNVNSNLTNSINSVNTNMINNVNSINNTLSTDVVRNTRLGARTVITMSKGQHVEYAGQVLTGLRIIGEVDGDDWAIFRQLQIYRGGTWVTVGQT